MPKSPSKRKRVEEMKEEYLGKLESVANFMRGVSLDPRMNHILQAALRERAHEIDSYVDKELAP